MSRALSRRAAIASAYPTPLDSYANVILTDTPWAYYRLNDAGVPASPPYGPQNGLSYVRDSAGSNRDALGSGGGGSKRLLDGSRRIDKAFEKVTELGESGGVSASLGVNVDATAGVPLVLETWVQCGEAYSQYRTLFRWGACEVAIYNQTLVPVTYAVDNTPKTLKFCVKKPVSSKPDSHTILLSGTANLSGGNRLDATNGPADHYADEVWRHIAVVVEYLTATSRHVTMYVDGVIDAEADVSWTGTVVNQPMSIGGGNGTMDEIVIYRHDLTSGRIAAHIAAADVAFSPGSVPGLYLWHRSENLGYGTEGTSPSAIGSTPIPDNYGRMHDNVAIRDWGVPMSPYLYGAPPAQNEAWYAKLPRYRRMAHNDYPAIEYNPLTSTARFSEHPGWYAASPLAQWTAFFVFNPVLNNTEQVIFDACGYKYPGPGTPPVENAFVFGIDPEGAATTNSRVSAVLRTAAGTRTIAADTVNTPTGAWNIYVVRYNGTTLGLYRGTSTTPVATATVSGFEIEAGIFWRIGRAGDNGGGGRYFRGSMMELGLFERALTTAEIGAIQTYCDRRYS